MENMLEIVSVPVIGTVVYWIVNLIKYTTKNNEKVLRFIPIIAAVLGASFEIICFYALPSVMVADNFLVALLIGGASGLSATGFNQVIKQLGKGKDEKNDEEKTNE